MGLHLLSAICGCDDHGSAGRQSKQTEQRHEQQRVGAGLGQLIDREVCYLDGYKQFTLNGEATFIGRLGQKLVSIGGSDFRQTVKPLRVQTGKGSDTAFIGGQRTIVQALGSTSSFGHILGVRIGNTVPGGAVNRPL